MFTKNPRFIFKEPSNNCPGRIFHPASGCPRGDPAQLPVLTSRDGPDNRSMAEAAKSRVVTCATCGARNRLTDAPTSGKAAVCGKCHKPLPAGDVKPVIVTDANFVAVLCSRCANSIGDAE